MKQQLLSILSNKLKGFEVLVVYTYGRAQKYFRENDVYETIEDFVRDCDTTNSIYFNNQKITIEIDEERNYVLMFGDEYDSILFKLIAPCDKAVAREIEDMF